MSTILLCSDLDRTILPNGKEPASRQALPIFRRIAKREEVVLVYVSGRNETLLKDAITEFDLPVPAYAIGDVGTTIYEPEQNWRLWGEYKEEIGRDWRGKTVDDIHLFLADMDELQLQEQENQNTHKLSYYTRPDLDKDELTQLIAKRLQKAGVRCSLIWSLDEEKECGLMDILPERATKLHGIKYLMKKKGFSDEQVLFAGDSGNDFPALTSGLKSVLVKNGRAEVREEAVAALQQKKMVERLYLARGDFFGMNGNYCAGVLEGLAHFFPQTLGWMKEK